MLRKRSDNDPSPRAAALLFLGAVAPSITLASPPPPEGARARGAPLPRPVVDGEVLRRRHVEEALGGMERLRPRQRALLIFSHLFSIFLEKYQVQFQSGA